MDTSAKHTPLPWRISYNKAEDRFELRNQFGRLFSHFRGWSFDGVTTEDEDRANAAFIVQAVNSHYALVEACDIAQRYIGLLDEHPGKVSDIEWDAIYQKLRKALAAATSPQH